MRVAIELVRNRFERSVVFATSVLVKWLMRRTVVPLHSCSMTSALASLSISVLAATDAMALSSGGLSSTISLSRLAPLILPPPVASALVSMAPNATCACSAGVSGGGL